MNEHIGSLVEYFDHFSSVYKQKNEGISTFVTVKPEIMSFYRRKNTPILHKFSFNKLPNNVQQTQMERRKIQKLMDTCDPKRKKMT